MAGSGGLQLLPQTRKRLGADTMGGNTFLILSIVAFVLVMAGYFGLMIYKNSLFSQADALNAQLDAIEQSRNKPLEKQLLSFSQQMASVSSLLGSHVFMSDALNRVQALILPRVQFESFDLDVSKKSLNFKALADSYTTVAHQISAFYGESTISDISLNKVSTMQDGKIEFDMKLDFAGNTFIGRAGAPSPSPQISP